MGDWTDVVERARLFAIEAHRETRYGKLPYEFHLEAVVNTLPPDASEEAVAAAWLHDTVEDTEVTLHDIRQEFGGRVARLVDAVTDEPGPNRKARKAGMYKKLVAAPYEARAIKLADRIANMRASIENPKLGAMYRKEFPEFIRKVGKDPENQELVLEAFWLYLDSVESSDGQ
jgi:(p)ppGpp synthase/HD superfamily hydrolase